MNILYLSSVCSQQRFDQYAQKGMIKKLPQAQKYHTLMLEGIRVCSKDNVTVLSSYPVVGKKKSKIFFGEEEECGGVVFKYLGFYQLPFLRQICLRFNAYKEIKKYCKTYKSKEKCIVCDVLNHSIAGAALLYRKFYHIHVCGIVTDVAGHTSGARAKTCSLPVRMFKKLCGFISSGEVYKYNSYLLLTEQMNSVVNRKKHPYIVLEGQADIKMSEHENSVHTKSAKKILMYAGGIHKEFGIERFVNAFLTAAPADWELHIYGDGNYSSELAELGKTEPRVVYFGVKPNFEIIEKQLCARVLVNPRLTDAEYVKYSFPSKTMECMASGTPLLTTKLPGMPHEYYPYLFLFDGETEEKMAEAVKTVTQIPDEALMQKGKAAKDFILRQKNNVVQAKKLMDFLGNNVRCS